jgi:hypothetical protein
MRGLSVNGLNGLKVRDLLPYVNTLLGGGSNGFSISDLDPLTQNINQSFLFGYTTSCAATPPKWSMSIACPDLIDRKKDGKLRWYFSMVESGRLSTGRTAQRTSSASQRAPIPSGAAANRSRNLESATDEQGASRTGYEGSAHPV